MLKKLYLAIVPVAMLSANVSADEALDIDVNSIQDAKAEIVEFDLEIDVDQLSAEAGEDSGEDAIEACFRRFRYNCRSWGRGYRNLGYRSWNCHSYCRPFYSYRTIRYCRPIYRIASPVYHYYWGCH